MQYCIYVCNIAPQGVILHPGDPALTSYSYLLIYRIKIDQGVYIYPIV